MKENHFIKITSEKTMLKQKAIYGKTMPQLKDSHIITAILLFIFVTVMFFISVNMRSEYKDYVSTDHHHHLTATSVIFTNNWLDDGIINDHFAMMPNPQSVEFETLKDRSFYDSYPPGCIIPLYVLAKLSGKQEITFGFVQRWNLFNQYVITLLLSFTVYLIFLRIRNKPYIGGIAAIIPVVTNLFMPAPFYFFHSVYFADMAVLLPFTLTIFLETIRLYITDKKQKNILSVILGIVIFAGALTDYLYLCVIFVLYFKKLFMKEISFKSFSSWFIDSLKFSFPALSALLLFALQVYINGPVRIIDSFMFRTGMDDASGWTDAFEGYFWKVYIVNGYGMNSDLILKGSLAVLLISITAYFIFSVCKKHKNTVVAEILSIGAMTIIPCFMQVYLLKNHSVIHDFSSLKFSICLAIVPYVLIPSAIICFIETFINDKTFMIETATTIFLLFTCVNVYSVHTASADSFFPEATTKYEAVGNFIKNNTDYNDVVFSNNYNIEDSNNYPQSIAFSKKRVYRVANIQNIYDKVKNISDAYTINIFSADGEVTEELKDLADNANKVIQDGDMYLYKIDKNVFLSMVH